MKENISLHLSTSVGHVFSHLSLAVWLRHLRHGQVTGPSTLARRFVSQDMEHGGANSLHNRFGVLDTKYGCRLQGGCETCLISGKQVLLNVLLEVWKSPVCMLLETASIVAGPTGRVKLFVSNKCRCSLFILFTLAGRLKSCDHTATCVAFHRLLSLPAHVRAP